MTMLTLYARREPTTDAETLRMCPDAARRRYDVVIYRDAAATARAGRYPWFYRSKPRRNQRFTMLNCWRYRLVWLPDVKARLGR
jgi:hypothetical protein